jgi:hypothetical protein
MRSTSPLFSCILIKSQEISRVRYSRQLYQEEGPLVELAPLPASAQFLNVIESIFSGMARAIIHNSDYGSVEDAMAAIDRYFAERNQNFLENPKRAGQKIWGLERTPAVFAEGQSCKEPRFR